MTVYQFLRLRPVALILWTAISTGIFKFRQTTLQNYTEIMFIFSVSVLLSHAILFFTLLYDASSKAPGPEVVGKLDRFLDQDQDQDQNRKQGTGVTGVAGGSSAGTSSGSVTKRSTTATTEPSSSSSSSSITGEDYFLNKDENMFWVLEKDGFPIGSIGAQVDKTRGVARLECWVVQDVHQRNGCGTLLLKTAMDQLSEKKFKIKSVRAILQGYQVPALRLFHKFNFEQLDRTPEWLGERVVLEIETKDWIKNHSK